MQSESERADEDRAFIQNEWREVGFSPAAGDGGDVMEKQAGVAALRQTRVARMAAALVLEVQEPGT